MRLYRIACSVAVLASVRPCHPKNTDSSVATDAGCVCV